MGIQFFIIIQISLFLWIIIHDWISLYPLNDIATLKRYHTSKELLINSVINGFMVLVPLIFSIYGYLSQFTYQIITILILFYAVLTVGSICAWWIPYIFGRSGVHKAGFLEYRNTHSFLPKRGTNVVPNTLHVILHVQIWFALFISMYLLKSW